MSEKVALKMRILLFIVCLTWTSSATLESFETKIVSGQLNTVISNVVNSSVQFIIHYEKLVDAGLRVNTICNEAEEEQPVLIVVRQQKGVLSWQIPFFVKRDDYSNEYDRYFSVNRTLCPIENNVRLLQGSAIASDIFITVSSSSSRNVKFSILLYRQENFFISDIREKFTAQVSPSAPIFFQVNLPHDVDSALIKMTSQDRVCAILSVQNISCPVYDLDLNVQFEGSYQTVDQKAGLAFTKEEYPLGAYIVLVAKTDDAMCHDAQRLVQDGDVNDRKKFVEFDIERLITNEEYFIATIGAFGMFLGFYAVVILISCVLCIKDYRMGSIEDRVPIISTIEATLEGAEEDTEEDLPRPRQRHNAEPNGAQDEIQVVEENVRDNVSQSDSSIDETDIDFLQDAEFEKDVFRTKTFLYVSDLARKSPRVLAKKSSLYNWNLMTIAIFYGLPVVQLVLTYQNLTNSTGNQDMCYYNFLCAHPLGLVKDFNHIFSNLGYVMLGILFVMIVSRKEYLHSKLSLDHRKKFGIPQHFGMYYAMGLALIMEGIMSGCYHVCPNHTNFQFDTAFMYTISILILLKIYQTRHPDINANAYTAFGVLAFIIFIGVIGVLHGSIYFWIFFTAIHCLSCLILSFQVKKNSISYTIPIFKMFSMLL